MTSREDTKTYLSKREIPQLFESLMTGLMYHKPENHVDFLRNCLGSIESGQNCKINWNMFVDGLNPQNPLPPISTENSSVEKKTLHTSEPAVVEMRKTSPLPPIASTKLTETDHLIRYVFIIGGPGSGKSALCKKITDRYDGYTHLSIGDILRQQVEKLESVDDKWKTIAELVRNGEFVPKDTIFEILKSELENYNKSETLGFIIEGFPRTIEQLEEFQREFGTPDLLLSLDSVEYRMKYRLEKRIEEGQRPDDNTETIQKRLEAYKSNTIPVLDLYAEQSKSLQRVNVDRDADEIFYDVANLFDSLFFTPREDAAPLVIGKVADPLPAIPTDEARQTIVEDAISHLPMEPSEIEPQSEIPTEDNKDETESKPEVVEETIMKEDAYITGDKGFKEDGEEPVAKEDTSVTSEKEQNEVVEETVQKEETPITGDKGFSEDLQKLRNSTIIFVVGGPGSGKGTQCEKIVEKYGFTHLSSGDLLRSEVNSGSERGKELTAIMEAGQLAPQETVLALLREEMLSKAEASCGFLIDGYPREVDQGTAFESQIAECKFVLYFEVDDETMKQRLLHRAKTSGRADDNEETIAKRLVTFHEVTEPMVNHYTEKDKLKKVTAERTPDEIFTDVIQIFKECGIPEKSEEVASEEKTPDETTSVEKTVDETAADEKTVDEIAADEKTADETTADEKTADETAADEKTADESAADEKNSAGKNLEEKTSDEITADEKTPASDENKLKDKSIFFVVGGPGSGKGTQCAKIVKKYGFTHLSSGDLLRAEVASGSERGQQIDEMMKKGELVPLSQVLELLKKAILKEADMSKGFLIDGYPRDIEQGAEFESKIAECSFVLYFEAKDETLTSRLMERSKTSGRVDDNEETIKKRLETFHNSTKPMVEHYASKGKLKQISAEGNPEEVFAEVVKLFDESGIAPLEQETTETVTKQSPSVKYFCVVGGPGSGKKEVAKSIATKSNFVFISIGELLLAESQKDSEESKAVNEAVSAGQLVPTAQLVSLLREEIQKSKDCLEFIIEGFPRNVEQSQEFEKQIGPIQSVLFLEGSQEELTQNISSRAETSGRADDSGDAAQLKVDVFFQQLPSIMQHFKSAVETKARVKQVSFKDVAEDVSTVLDIFTSLSDEAQETTTESS